MSHSSVTPVRLPARHHWKNTENSRASDLPRTRYFRRSRDKPEGSKISPLNCGQNGHPPFFFSSSFSSSSHWHQKGSHHNQLLLRGAHISMSWSHFCLKGDARSTCVLYCITPVMRLLLLSTPHFSVSQDQFQGGEEFYWQVHAMSQAGNKVCSLCCESFSSLSAKQAQCKSHY